MTFEFQPKTIIMMVGPSHCGKSYFSKLLQKSFSERGYKNIYLSSDEYRQQMIGENLHKHHNDMMEVSKQAFNLLYATLDNYTQYPVNIDFAIVDATNISQEARQPFINIAKKNGYNLVAVTFEYKDNEEYFKYVTEEENKEVISNMVFRFKKEMKDFIRKDFKTTYKITSRKQIEDYKVEVIEQNKEEFKINTFENVIIFGDIHGDYETFIEAIKKTEKFDVNDEEIPFIVPKESFHIILVGDYIDKNTDENVKKTIDFIYKNKEHITIVKGNHERHCYDVLRGVIKRDEAENLLIRDFFNSVLLFDKDEETKEKFQSLYKNSVTFLEDFKNRFIITHAPCSISALGKLDSKSLKSMNTIRYPKMDAENIEGSLEEREKFFQFIKDEAESCNIWHIFGHVALNEVFKYKNKLGIDTGSVYGNYLSFVIFSEHNKKPFISKQKSVMESKGKELYPLFRTKQVDRNIDLFDIDTKRFLKFASKNKINFISGTMSPVNKSENNLEDIMTGIEYYKSNGVDKIILQTKKMGSRCNVYIHKTNVDECYLVTRNGYKISPKMIGMSDESYKMFLISLQGKYSNVFDELNAEFILFDGELLPWNVLGKGLIEKDFVLPYKLGSFENQYLLMNGFHQSIGEIITSENIDNETKRKNLKKVNEAIEGNIIRAFVSENEDLEKFHKQVQHFGRTYEVDFSAFSILKYRLKGGKEVNMLETNEMSNIEVYKLLGHTVFAVLDFETNRMYHSYNETNKETEISSEEILKFYNYLTSEPYMEEGVVIKPEKMYQTGIAPYLKARNPEYLRITYGYNYLMDGKYEELVKGKNIKNKLKTSIYEWELARELLNIDIEEISLQNSKWVSLIANFYKAIEREKELDPRL